MFRSPALICLSFSILFLSFRPLSGQELQRFEFSHRQMGTTFRIIFYAADASLASDVAKQVFARIDTLNRRLSDYLPNSELNHLTATAGSGRWVAVSTDLWTVLQASRQMSKKTNGAFDVSIGPLSKLWRRAFRRQEFPDSLQILEAKSLVGYRNIRLQKREKMVKLSQPDMRLDLGGIAKGYALDEAMNVLQRAGCSKALIDGGGDILVGEAPPGKSGWTIGYLRYDQDSLVQDSIVLERQAIATSGDRYRFLSWKGQRYSHIINPRTGLGTSEERLVTVIAATGMQSDALASAFSIIPKKDLEKWKRRFPNAVIRIFTKS